MNRPSGDFGNLRGFASWHETSPEFASLRYTPVSFPVIRVIRALRGRTMLAGGGLAPHFGGGADYFDTSLPCSNNSPGMFRPCIDLHEGKVKQIVGGSLSDSGDGLRTNFVSEKSAAWFAQLYQRDGLKGGHVIMLGSGNEAAAREALAAYPGGLHIGGGVNIDNAKAWLDAGASHVIVTSWVFRDGHVDWDRLSQLAGAIGTERLVIDLSCRKRDGKYFVVTDRWQKFTEETVCAELLQRMAKHCAEFLIHAADVEGLCRGIDEELVARLGAETPIPTTYAGGAKSLDDLETVTRVGRGRVDLTIGSALDIFGGTGIKYADAVAFNKSLGVKALKS